MSALLRIARRLVRNPSTPRQFPTTGFELITSSHLIEEEQWEWYKPEEFYPVRLGEIFKSQYQVVGKLGYGRMLLPGFARTYMTTNTLR